MSTILEPDETRAVKTETEPPGRHVREGTDPKPWQPRFLAAAVAGTLSALLVAIRTLLPVPVGLADDGGGVRYACQVGLTGQAGGGARFFDFAILRWATGDPAVGDDACPANVSSVTWLLGGVRGVATALGHDAVDLRLVSILYALVVGIVVGLVVGAVGGSVRRRVVVALALTLVAADAAFVGFAGSTYAESAALLGVLLLAPGLVLVAGPGWQRWAGLVVVVAGSALAAGARPTTAVLALPVAVYVVVTSWRRERPRGAGRRALVVNRAVAVVAAAAVLAPAAWVVAGESDRSRTTETWAMVSQRSILDEETASVELHSMGFTADVLPYATGEVPGFPASDAWDANEGVLQPATVWSFLFAHPDRAVAALDDTAGRFLAARPAGLGSYSADAGMPPRAQESRVAVASTVLGWFQGAGLLALLVLWAGAALVGIQRARSATGAEQRRTARAALVLLGCSVLGTVAVAFGVGAAPGRAVVPAVLCTLLALALLVASRRSGPSPVLALVGRAGERGRVALSGAGEALRGADQDTRPVERD